MDYTGVADDELERVVREHLEADPAVDASEIEVRVEDGRVSLRGTVGSEVERETAERIVTDVIGLDVAANELRVEPTAREEARAAGAEGSGEQVTGMAQYEWEGDPETSETIGTEDEREASDEGRSFTPPDAPVIDALFTTDPPHGVAEERPRPVNESTRDRRADEAVGRAMKEAPDRALRHVATESAQQFKEAMRARGKRGGGDRSGGS